MSVLLTWTGPGGLDREEFSAVYRGSALENCREMYPEEPDGEAALARYEREHLAYMAGPFWEEGGVLLVLAGEDGRYRAAVKLYPWEDERCWHVEGLETRPGERRKGYGVQLLREAQRWLERTGAVTLLSDVGKGNEASLRTHAAAGFRRVREEWRELDGSVQPARCTMMYRTQHAPAR